MTASPARRRDIAPVPARPLLDPDIRRVAIVRLRVGLGDLLASVPALRALKKARPDVQVSMITWSEVASVVGRMSNYVDDLFPFPGYPGIPDRTPRRRLLPAFLNEARRRRFDLALQMYGAHAAANEVTSRLGARVIGGFFTPGLWDADLTTHLPYPLREHEIRRHLLLMEFLGAPAGSSRLEFPMRPRDETEKDRLAAENSLEPFTYVCVHAGATAASRRWPPELFARVADALSDRGLRIVLTGVAGEDAASAVASHMRSKAVDVSNRTSLGAFAALLQSSSLLVTNDSGPAQLAAALETPSVTIFLAGDPKRWRGLDVNRHAVVQAGAHCQPCGLLDCPIDFRCAAIEPEQVVRIADAVLHRTSSLRHEPEEANR